MPCCPRSSFVRQHVWDGIVACREDEARQRANVVDQQHIGDQFQFRSVRPRNADHVPVPECTAVGFNHRIYWKDSFHGGSNITTALISLLRLQYRENGNQRIRTCALDISKLFYDAIYGLRLGNVLIMKTV